jgi:hypothetical protein
VPVNPRGRSVLRDLPGALGYPDVKIISKAEPEPARSRAPNAERRAARNPGAPELPGTRAHPSLAGPARTTC